MDETGLKISGGDPKRAKEKAGWALLKAENSRSWIGGLPHAPVGFEWPRNVNSKPLHFFGQLDILEVRKDSEAVVLAGLPEDGSILFFAGYLAGKGMISSCLKYSGSQMNGAIEQGLPTDLETLGTLGFSPRDREQTFQKRFVRPTRFQSFGDERDKAIFEAEYGVHRFLGLEPPFSNNWDDLRGKDCLISFGEDREFGTLNDHHYGLSTWCSREDLDAGEYSRGKCVLHHAV